MSFSQPELITLLLISARLLAWLMVAPPIATAGVPRTVRVALSVGLALPLVHQNLAHAPSGDFAAVAGAVLEQVVIGTALGFLTRLLFTAIEAAGGLLDLFGGFSLSAAYEPLSNTMTSIFGKFYGILATTLIFVTNAHLVIFGGILRTFEAIPLDGTIHLNRLDAQIASTASGLFVAALQIAGPVLVVLFLADIALGVLNRIAPQLNAFSLSFPVKIGLTLLLVGGSMTLMPQVVLHLADQADRVVSVVTG
ncbi:MAG: flagellar biosynthetic protein FliR [Jatrophihabitans sp.]|uniref:flagellar biosynthetic protein FliR n=1 Tax=Jatrophihabitans sp. TaxID=1932789 RepID=UPI003F7E9E68